MSADHITSDIASAESLPGWLPSKDGLRGRLRQNASLAKRCWFGVGGTARLLYTPADAEDLSVFLSYVPEDLPITMLGVGSNLLVRDGGIDGIVIRLGRGFAGITHDGEGTITAGAAALDVHVAHYAAEHGFAGLEFLIGIPGTIGGAVRMNAGAYGSDISEVAHEITLLNRQGEQQVMRAEQAGFSYRHASFSESWIVTSVTLHAPPGDPAVITEQMHHIKEQREASQPVRSKTGGSTFKNPPGHKAWELIDAAGCRGLRHGDAEISSQHCNFMINHGNASANDLELLGEEVRQRVFAESGIMLEWEIKRIGNHAPILAHSTPTAKGCAS